MHHFATRPICGALGRSTSRVTLAVMMGASWLAAPLPALAQMQGGSGAPDGAAGQIDAATPAGDAGVNPAGLEEIVVTARRREESLQSVPISVQAFSGATLEERNIQDVTDLQRLVPSLSTYQQARDEVTVSIRGLSSSGASAQGQNARVTAYFAQVPLQTGDGGGPGRFFDLQNVQVLKGPQGTLFGRNSTGGAVLYEPARPSRDLGGYVIAQYGRFDDRQLEAAINLPASDVLAFRFSGKYAKSDGFTRNIVTDQRLDDRNYRGLRASALLSLDRVENFLMFDYLKSDTNGSSQQIVALDPNFVFAPDLFRGRIPGRPIPLTLGGVGPSLAQFSANPAATTPAAIAAGRVVYFPNPLLQDQLNTQLTLGPRISQSTVDGLQRSRSWGITNITNVELGDNLTLKNIFGYRRYKQLSRYDFDGTALPLLDQVTPGGWSANLRQISEELQLQGRALDNKLQFTVGGFGLWQKSPKAQITEQLVLGVPARNLSSPVERSQAAFGQLTYDLSELAVEGLSITAGYRYTHDYRRVSASNFRDPAGLFPATSCGLIRGCPTVTSASFNNSSYNFSLDWQITPKTLAYITHRTSYRAGGLNPQALDFGVQYDPEDVSDIEAGLKTDLSLGGIKGRFNAALYRTKLKDAQVSESFPTINPLNGQVSLINLIVNAARATIKGAEAELTLVPVTGLQLSAAYAYTDAGYDQFVSVLTGQPLDRPFPFVAKHRGVIGARWTLPAAKNVGTATLAANYTFSSAYSLSVFRDATAVENGFQQLDLRADLNDIAGTRLGAAIFVNNVTKELYRIGGVPILSVLGSTSVIYNEPRTWGVQLRYRFGEGR